MKVICIPPRAHKLALQLKTDIANSKLSEHFSVLMQGKNLNNIPDYVFFDDTKIWIGNKNKNITGKILREILFYQYGIYISRYTENAVMINIHIGITVSDIDYLLYAIENITKKLLDKHRNFTGFIVPKSSNQYIIPYPPEVPLVVPEEHVSEAAENKLNIISKAGISLMVIDA